MYIRVRDKPYFLDEDYNTKLKEPCVQIGDPEVYTSMEYEGYGISPDEHPLKRHIRFRECENCKSKNVLVIYAQWNVSTASGDDYWDYEAFCEDCKKYTICSFAGND